ncbi:MAG TPA: type VI secretion protein IcmF/TssM N-terminal domain-containing protein, partial [Dyella sp.]|nr:type VI secretion protein IcmF/TssM N-terminal domain-containing protein [Dyella sp.]
EWVGKAFDKLIVGLRGLVLQAATARDEIRDADDFFLFPQFMRVLQTPVREFLEIVFKPNVYEARAFCRGVYFTGVVGGNMPENARDGARNDVAFVDGLMRDKFFAERNLAQRTQKGLLARNGIIRRLQVGLLAATVALLVGLPWSAAQVRNQAQALRDTVVNISVSSKSLTQRGCLDEERLYKLIEEVGALDQRTRYAVIPLSWLDWRINSGITEVSRNALESVVLPSLACKLKQRIDALSTATLQDAATGTVQETNPAAAFQKDKLQLKQQLADLGELEDNLDRFADIAKPGVQMDKRKVLLEFGVLWQYVYQSTLPPTSMKEDSDLADALVEARLDNPPAITQSLRTRLAEQFQKMAGDAKNNLLQRVLLGVPRLNALEEGRPPLLQKVRGFNAWLSWIRNAWLLSTPADNACTKVSQIIEPGIEDLITHHRYDPGLRNTLDDFSVAQCYQPAVDSLRSETLPSFGPLFQVDPTTQQLNGVSPELSNEAAGLKALADVGFMQVKSSQSYHCNGEAGGWNAAVFGEVLSYMRQYQVFASDQKVVTQETAAGGTPAQAPPEEYAQADKEPLFDSVARKQLGMVLEDTLARSQRAPAGQRLDTGLDATSQLDRQLSSESADMSATLQPLLQSLHQLRQLGFDAFADEVGQCAQNYASNVLQDVSELDSSSQLYNPPVQQGTDDSTMLFDLGSVPVLQAYLDRQLTRVQVLAGYAAPFVTLLRGAAGVNNSQRGNLQTDSYWGNTIGELNRAVQFADPAGQAAQLNDFFLKQLAGLTYANCTSTLNGYVSPIVGNDLFSARREAMLQIAQAACSGRGEINSNLHFVRIGMLFNSQLAGRYPFGPPDSHEVSPAIVKAFFVYYAKEKPELETWLATAKGATATRMKAFIDQLDAVQAFFAGNLLAQPQSGPTTVNVDFRALPASSPLSNQLIAWTLHVGGNTAKWPGSVAAVAWNVGDPVSLDLQWADRSRFTPVPDPSQPELTVSGYDALFQSGGSWALLHLLDTHKSNATASDALDPNLQTLRFQLPVLAAADASTNKRDTENAQFYLTVKLSAPDPTTKAVVPLAVPTFPREAPVLW